MTKKGEGDMMDVIGQCYSGLISKLSFKKARHCQQSTPDACHPLIHSGGLGRGHVLVVVVGASCALASGCR